MKYLFPIIGLYCFITLVGGCASRGEYRSVTTPKSAASPALTAGRLAESQADPSWRKQWSSLPWLGRQQRGQPKQVPPPPITIVKKDTAQESLQWGQRFDRARGPEEEREWVEQRLGVAAKAESNARWGTESAVQRVSWEAQLKQLYSTPLETSRLPLSTAVR